ncbi:MAG: hypothetical protein HY516_02045 [Candidatus Aenigmarchaeota archaeon]|nr:hypothetical protein [Candidatus Aenigmarchaeota archaeon]
MSEIALRSYVDYKKDNHKTIIRDAPNFDRVLIFDTETTTDIYQNLIYGSFQIRNKDAIEIQGIFYDPNISEIDKEIIQIFCKKHNLNLYTKEEFIENIFYPEVYYLETPCIGFNLPFDISRLAIKFGHARKGMRNGFSLQLSRYKKQPRVKIKHISNTLSFIQFASGILYNGKKKNFSGNFLDLKTLSFALTNDKLTLKSACERFNTEHRKTETEYNNITEKHLQYNLNDVQITYELYEKLKGEYAGYGLDLPLTKVFSPASLGKACLSKFGIKSFFEKNPNFSKDILGYVMTAYYGGRSEVKIREEPTKVTLIDFLSMYPSVCILQNLWDLITSEQIEVIDDTEKAREFVNDITLEKLRDRDTWKNLNRIVQILPNNDILPIRMKYGEKEAYNIGLNYATFKKPLYYALSDVIASKILTGKTPTIIKAFKFLSKEKQKGMNKANILGMEIDPYEDDLFKVLIEERNRSDEKRKKILKIIANSTSYGIFIETNPSDEEADVTIHGLESFDIHVNSIERIGFAYNPIIATLITSASRLILAITETILSKDNETYAFCDTDSMAVSPHCVRKIQEFFMPLNPYSFETPLFKVEKEDVWFYGISAKRYVLYKIENGNFDIIKKSLHGLGHLTNPFNSKVDWQTLFWEDVLKLHYKKTSEQQLREKYSSLYAIVRFAITTSRLADRFKTLRPFNFILIGIGNSKDVKPIVPFTKNPQEAVYQDFVDYNTGKTLNGLEYWKPLDQVFFDYVDHKENKFDGDKGVLRRKHIFVDKVVYIGKETDELESVGILRQPDYNIYNDPKAFIDKLLQMTTNEAKRMGIHRSTWFYIKKRAKSCESLRLSKKTYRFLQKALEIDRNEYEAT